MFIYLNAVYPSEPDEQDRDEIESDSSEDESDDDDDDDNEQPSTSGLTSSDGIGTDVTASYSSSEAGMWLSDTSVVIGQEEPLILFTLQSL